MRQERIHPSQGAQNCGGSTGGWWLVAGFSDEEIEAVLWGIIFFLRDTDFRWWVAILGPRDRGKRNPSTRWRRPAVHQPVYFGAHSDTPEQDAEPLLFFVGFCVFFPNSLIPERQPTIRVGLHLLSWGIMTQIWPNRQFLILLFYFILLFGIFLFSPQSARRCFGFDVGGPLQYPYIDLHPEYT